MKKYTILFLAFVLLLSGCNTVTQSTNTKTTETQPSVNANANTSENSKEKAVEPSAVAETEVASKDMIMPITTTNLIKSNKPEMSLEKIIVKIRGILEIGSDYDEVSTEEYSYEGTEKTYNVNYSNTKTNDSAWFSSDTFGNLISFGKYSTKYDAKVEINHSRAEAEIKAKELLNKLYGESSKEFTINDSPYFNSFDYPNYMLQIQRVVNGVIVPSDSISMEISKKDLGLISFNLMTQTNNDFSDTSYFAGIDDVKDKDEAFEKYKSENMMLKAYLGINSSQTGLYRELKYIPIFGIYGTQIPIDAKTLEPIYLSVDMMIGDGRGLAMGAAEEKGLTPTEQAHIDDVNAQNSAEKAEAAAREMFGLGNEYKLNYSNFTNFMGAKGVYVWSMSFTNSDYEFVSVSLLAKDLTLISYSSYSSEPMKDKTAQVANKNADNYVSMANNFLTEKGKMKLEDLEITIRSKNPQTDNIHNVEYVRKNKDGTHIFTDTILISIDKKSDKVTLYNKAWDFELTEDKLPKSFAISMDEAYDILKEQYGFKLVYRRDNSEKSGEVVKPYYELNSNSSYMTYNNIIVNAETGEIIDQLGQKVNFNNKIVYVDLDEAERPKIIEEMSENNIGYYGEDLRPKEKIKQIDLFKLFLSSTYYNSNISNMTDDEVYDMIKYMNLLEDEPREPQKIVTQKDYARYIARYRTYGDIGKLNTIFKDDFSDLKNTDKDFGYLVIAKEKGYIETEAMDQLNPNKEITRETALYYLYALKSKG